MAHRRFGPAGERIARRQRHARYDRIRPDRRVDSPKPMSTAAPPATRLRVASRIGAAVFGGYAFAWGVVAAGASLWVAAGLDFHDAEFLSSLLGVLAFLVAFLWAFAARRLWVVWTVLAGGGALLAATASFVQSLLV